ncbi:unnamed protein product [Prorocentrum cordatum]|uniref:Uncharacterized protein n=1 Tax=Prorocentrum cordatum TaxID=2364126 RepID=A0ABN9X3B1_9DINO|nr:unnamed protein product [Polarella glacialis]
MRRRSRERERRRRRSTSGDSPRGATRAGMSAGWREPPAEEASLTATRGRLQRKAEAMRIAAEDMLRAGLLELRKQELEAELVRLAAAAAAGMPRPLGRPSAKSAPPSANRRVWASASAASARARPVAAPPASSPAESGTSGEARRAFHAWSRVAARAAASHAAEVAREQLEQELRHCCAVRLVQGKRLAECQSMVCALLGQWRLLAARARHDRPRLLLRDAAGARAVSRGHVQARRPEFHAGEPPLRAKDPVEGRRWSRMQLV